MASFIGPAITSGYHVLSPAAPTVTFATTGGFLNSAGTGNYMYTYTFVTANGESLPSPGSAAATSTSPGLGTGLATVTIAQGPAYVTARKLYRTIQGGASFLLVTTINDNQTTSVNDGLIDSSLGAAQPTTSTADSPAQTFASSSVTLTTTTPNITFQPGGSGFSYKLQASTNPAQNSTFLLVDPGIATVNLQTGVAKISALPAGANTTLTAAQSGSIFTIPTQTGQANTVTLPAVQAGLNFTFITSATNTTFTLTISAVSGTPIVGILIGVAATVAKTAALSLVLSATTANVKVGDKAVFQSDGTNWYVVATSAGAASGWS